MRPVLGTFGSPLDPDDLLIDVDRLLSSRLLLQAQSGAGKSWALRRILEQTHGLCQQLVIDPEGEFATLRAKFDYVLAAKDGGDVLAAPRTAKLLAEKLLELRVSAVLDLYELSVHERVQFVRYFLEALINAPKHLWHPCLVVIDEAHAYCPEKGEAESLNAVIDLCSKGRKRGFAALLATQRLAKLHKDAAAECANKLIGRCTLDVDMKRAAEELGFTTKEEKLGLRTLKTGEFYTYGPALGLTAAVRRVMVGDVVTPHPKAGQRSAATAPAPSDKVKAVLAKLADLPAEAAAREKTLADLQRENRDLRVEVKKLQQGQPEMDTDRVKKLKAQVAELQRAAKLNIFEQLEQLRKAWEGYEAKFHAIYVKLETTLGEPTQMAEFFRSVNQPLLQEANPAPMPPTRAERRRGATRLVGRPLDDDGKTDLRVVRAAGAPPNGASEALSGPEQRILDACAWWERDTGEVAPQVTVAFLAGYTYGAGGFNNPKGRLRSLGLIEYLPKEMMRLTAEGKRQAQPPPQLLTTSELHHRVLARLPGPERRILAPLLALPAGDMMDVDLLAQKAQYAPGTGGFNNPKGHLRSLTLIEYPSQGYARANLSLFVP